MFLDDFKDNQEVCYRLLKNSLLSNKVSHAYLFDVNNYEKAIDFVFAFIKSIVCENHYFNDSFDDCINCSICKRIADGNYPEIKIIESDSNVIKKEQLLELQADFSMLSIEGSYRIYIIKDCDKMNKQASNCLLKFLEEPVDGVIAILVSNNVNKLLSTIVSRCQLIRFENKIKYTDSTLNNLSLACCNSNDEILSFRDDKYVSDLIGCVINFIDYFENNGLDILLYMKKMWYNTVQTRDNHILAFKMLIYFYYDVLMCKLGVSDFLFCEQVDLVKKISDLNDSDKIVKKINVFQYGYDMLLANLNVNLLLDDIVIRLGEI